LRRSERGKLKRSGKKGAYSKKEARDMERSSSIRTDPNYHLLRAKANRKREKKLHKNRMNPKWRAKAKRRIKSYTSRGKNPKEYKKRRR